MVCPDYGVFDHVGRAVALDKLGKRLKQRLEYPGLHLTAISSKHAVPLPVLVRKMPPLRACPSHPEHAFEVPPIVVRGSAATPALRRQQQPDQRPLLVRNSDPLAQSRPQKTAVNQPQGLASSFVHEA